MAVKVRPLHDRLIVERIEEEGEQKVGGIIIPDTAKEKPQQGKVIAAGKGKLKDDGSVTPLDVQAGDTVLFGKYSGQEIKLDGEEFLIKWKNQSYWHVEWMPRATLEEITGGKTRIRCYRPTDFETFDPIQ